MAVESFPFGISAETYSAEITRRTIGSIYERSANAIGTTVGGVIGSGDFAITPPGSGLSVNVAAGECVVPGSVTFASTPSGYYLRNTASLNVTGFTQNPSNPTVYLICATINDTAYHGVVNSGVIQSIAGTPSAGATLTNLTGAPAVPDASLLLGYALVPSGSGGSITTVSNTQPYLYFGPNIFNKRPSTGSLSALSGDHIIVASGSGTYTLPAPFTNARVRVTNFGSGIPTVSHNASEKIFGLGMTGSGVNSFTLGTPGATATVESDGTSWYVVAGAQDSGYVVATYQNSFAIFGSAATYRLVGNRVQLGGGAQGGSSNTAAFTLPSGFRLQTQQNFSCSNGNTAFGSTIVDVGTAGVVVIKDSTYGVDLGSISFLVD